MMSVWQQAYAEKGTYQGIQVDAGAGMQHSHTLWGLLRAPSLLLHGVEEPWQHTAYVLAVIAVFGLLAVHAMFRESEPWRKAALMVIAAITLPFVSADYTTPLIYFPLVMFLNSRRVSRYDLVYVALFGALLIPVDYGYLPALGTIDASVSVIVYAAALVALAALTMGDAVRQERTVPVARALRLRAGGARRDGADAARGAGLPARRRRRARRPQRQPRQAVRGHRLRRRRGVASHFASSSPAPRTPAWCAACTSRCRRTTASSSSPV